MTKLFMGTTFPHFREAQIKEDGNNIFCFQDR